MKDRRVLAVLAAALLGAAAWYGLSARGRTSQLQYVTAAVQKGEVANVVGATGTLEAVTTVQVGSQVSGTIQSLNADFNSRVSKGQVVARLDPSLFEARLSQAQANLQSAQANLERSKAAADDARQKYARARELSAEALLPASDLETARSNSEGAAAQVKASQAAVSQAAAAVNQAQVDLAHTVIKAPIEGVVVARNVDVGQTVAASLQAPTLFVIAEDLARMQVKASIDEADVGRVAAELPVEFRVDAYPDRTFSGRVRQVRLQPVTNQNVVTYDTVIDVDNAEQLLKPGMTATVSIVVDRRPDVLRIPVAALRFRPPREEREGGRGEARAASPGASPPASPEERPRGEGRRGDGQGRGRRQPGATGGGTPAGDRAAAARVTGGGGAPPPEGAPRAVYVLDAEGQPERRPIVVGLSDGQYVEVREGLREGETVVVGQEGGEQAGGPRPAASGSNPFAPNMQRQRRQR